MKTQNTAYRLQNGFSLVELMIATTIGLLLMVGVTQIFLTNKQTYRVQEELSRLQENGRFAALILKRETRMAGFSGCASAAIATPNIIADVNGDNTVDQVASLATDGIDGYEYADLPVAFSDTETITTADVLAGTDVLIIKKAVDSGVKLDGNMDADNAQIQLNAATAAGLFQADDVLIISDCTSTDIFVANNVSNGTKKITIAHPNSVNISNKLSQTYNDDARVMKMEVMAYYVGPNDQGEPALFRKRFEGSSVETEELIDGVEDLEVLYGEDTDGDRTANRYLSAGAVNTANVVSVRLTLVARTLSDNVAADTGPSGDRRIRRTYTTTVAIRNKLP